MQKLPAWFYILLAVLWFVLSLFGNVLTSLWTPKTTNERFAVIVAFAFILCVVIVAEYIQRVPFQTSTFWNKIQPWLSPWWLIVLGVTTMMLAFLFNRNFVMIAAMATLFCISIIFALEKMPLFRRKKRPPLHIEPLKRFETYVSVREPKDGSNNQ